MGELAAEPPGGSAADVTPTTPPADRQLAFLQELLEEQATIAGDIIAIDEHTWAIHGSLAVDGDEILAEFTSEEQARRVLGQLPRPVD